MARHDETAITVPGIRSAPNHVPMIPPQDAEEPPQIDPDEPLEPVD